MLLVTRIIIIKCTCRDIRYLQILAFCVWRIRVGVDTMLFQVAFMTEL